MYAVSAAFEMLRIYILKQDKVNYAVSKKENGDRVRQC